MCEQMHTFLRLFFVFFVFAYKFFVAQQHYRRANDRRRCSGAERVDEAVHCLSDGR